MFELDVDTRTLIMEFAREEDAKGRTIAAMLIQSRVRAWSKNELMKAILAECAQMTRDIDALDQANVELTKLLLE